jgi:hypothetical protein
VFTLVAADSPGRQRDHADVSCQLWEPHPGGRCRHGVGQLSCAQGDPYSGEIPSDVTAHVRGKAAEVMRLSWLPYLLTSIM